MSARRTGESIKQYALLYLQKAKATMLYLGQCLTIPDTSEDARTMVISPDIRNLTIQNQSSLYP
ncbi:hypothetical protein K3G39_07670 [Pontibacter sp. HSC-14F20]|uniref:hypothetical protein n=1 Tax=Pontibacter sp. HSC-14F20 TaxID=2864136 RepID=UPI001C736C9E|nr:hypothetical protein [Pontibacter sp. HSC-14F20]MBX0333112.1 hypothetical protein [Pontibacter sp. HSC-14F20]